MVKPPEGEEKVVRIPRDFLLRRSRGFRDLLKRTSSLSDSDQLQLDSTSLKTVEDFLIWSHSCTPQIEAGGSFDDTVKLGIFATTYQIPALGNQITDQIRKNLASQEWHLSPNVVDDIYAATIPGSPLREVIRAAFGQSPKPRGEEWKSTFLNHSEIGWDYNEVDETEWSVEDYLAEVCRFHDHEDVTKLLPADVNKCPYREEECYPVDQGEANGEELKGEGEFESQSKEAMVNGDGLHGAEDYATAADEPSVHFGEFVNDGPAEQSRAREWLLKGDNGTEDEVNGTAGGTSESVEPRESESWADADGRTILSEQTNEEVYESIADASIDEALPEVYGDRPAVEEVGPPQQKDVSLPTKHEANQTAIESPPPAVGSNKQQKKKNRKKSNK